MPCKGEWSLISITLILYWHNKPMNFQCNTSGAEGLIQKNLESKCGVPNFISFATTCSCETGVS